MGFFYSLLNVKCKECGLHIPDVQQLAIRSGQTGLIYLPDASALAKNKIDETEKLTSSVDKDGRLNFMRDALCLQCANKLKQDSPRRVSTDELELIGTVNVGKYLFGLPATDLQSNNIECAFTDDNFIFYRNSAGSHIEYGRIARNAINEIFIDDKSQIAQRITVTRILTLGIFSLAAPQKTIYKDYCLVIDWEDERGIRNNTIFEFSENNSEFLANTAINTLKKYIKPKLSRLKDDEKKCPQCAEIIKKEAKLCRFCRMELAP